MQQVNTSLLQTIAKLRQTREALQAKLTMLGEANARLNARLKDPSKDRRIAQLTHDAQALRQQLAQAAQERQASKQELDTLRETAIALQAQLAALTETNKRLGKDPLTLQATLTALTEETRRREQAMQELAAKLRQAQQLAQEQTRFKLEADTLRETLQQDRGALYRELGALSTKAQLFDRAINAYQKSLEAEPDHAQTHYYLGLLYQHAKNNDERAVAHLQRYLALSPKLSPKQRKDIDYVINMLQTKEPPVKRPNGNKPNTYQ